MAKETTGYEIGKWVGDIIAERNDGYSTEAHAHAEKVAKFFAEDDCLLLTPRSVQAPAITVTPYEESPAINSARQGVAAAFEERIGLAMESQV